MMRFILLTAMIGCFLGNLGADPVATRTAPKAFLHPGLLHTQADFDRMKTMLARGAEPWRSGFDTLKNHAQSKADYRPRGPFPIVVRDPRGSQRIAELEMDGNAAYQNALMWALTGQEAHARKAVAILNAWSGTLREITGKDKELGASLCGFKFANAAEIMRGTYPSWPTDEVRRCATMLREVFHPVIRDFATFANGNWDTGCLKTVLAIGIFTDDPELVGPGGHFALSAEKVRFTDSARLCCTPRLAFARLPSMINTVSTFAVAAPLPQVRNCGSLLACSPWTNGLPQAFCEVSYVSIH